MEEREIDEKEWEINANIEGILQTSIWKGDKVVEAIENEKKWMIEWRIKGVDNID